MTISAITGTNWSGPSRAAVSFPNADQRNRLMAAFGLTTGGLPKIDQCALARYYTYLSANLSLPFRAYYPQPTNAKERTQFCCTVVELLDPTKHLGDEIDGIFCKVRKGQFEVNLPLIELNLSQASPNLQLIEDYGHWFGNWR
jgi:hypothetical protein